jgi:hypothetical protein
MAIIPKTTTLCFVFIFAMFGSSLCKSKLDLQQVQEKLQNGKFHIHLTLQKK